MPERAGYAIVTVRHGTLEWTSLFGRPKRLLHRTIIERQESK